MPQTALTPAQQAVMDVIAAETASFYRRDFETFAECWAHDPTIRRFGWWTRSGVTDTWGWEELKRLTLRSFAEYPHNPRNLDLLRRENVIVEVEGTMAYATFDEYTPNVEDQDPDDPVCGRAARVLRLIDGRWRIVFHSYVLHTLEPSQSPMLRVGRNGAIIWMNRSAERVLGRGDLLRADAGRLVSNTAPQTKALRAAIRDASLRDESLGGLRACIPVLLEQGDDHAPSVCWVTTEGTGSGTVLVSLNNLDFALDKIDAAAKLFGLSRAQQRLAELIASGHDMVTSAAQLGITTNTAKTHLQRIFDKTGVRSQAALIRTLLSIERPE